MKDEQPIPEIGLLQSVASSPTSTRIERTVAAAALVVRDALSHQAPQGGAPETSEREMTVFDHLAAMARHQRAVVELDSSALNLHLVIDKDNWGFQGTVLGLPGCTVRANTEADVLEAARAAARRWIHELENPPVTPPGTKVIEFQLA